jgi:hypothetical protein
MRQYPKQSVYLDGDLIVTHYGKVDPRNQGECAISMLFDPETEEMKMVLEIGGEEFPIRLYVGVMVYDDSTETTTVFTLKRI